MSNFYGIVAWATCGEEGKTVRNSRGTREEGIDRRRSQRWWRRALRQKDEYDKRDKLRPQPITLG